jgi:uncharacterized protein
MRRKTVAFSVLPIAVCFVLLAGMPARGQEKVTHLDYPAIFNKMDVMIPMRDGVRLHTEIYVPKHISTPLPFIFERTPYGLHDGPDGFTRKLRIYDELIADGYIFVFQDIRGRYKSEGHFVMFRDPCVTKDPKCIDEGTDTNDTIKWLLKHIPDNNGRVGILGISYGGYLTTMAILHPSPAIKAASEQASPADQFLGDDFHHNGAFRESYGFEYSTAMETGKTNYSFEFSKFDTFDWYLNNLGLLSNANRLYLHGTIPTWDDFVNHPNYDEFWQKQAFAPYLRNLTLKVPLLNVTGWWDQEDFYGPNKIYALLKKHDANHYDYLAAGPWNHGGWAGGTGRSLGAIDFGSNTSEYFRKHIQAPWFAYWLKGEGRLPFHRAEVFQTGTNRWEMFDHWPPRANVRERKLYFHPSSILSFSPPKQNDAREFVSYVSDPMHPVPYRHRPISRTYGPVSGWYTWLVQDQRFVYLRAGVVAWETRVLEHPVTVTGDIVAHLYASTTGTDSDWIVKLIDVYPEAAPKPTPMEGYQLMIADEVFRGRFRKSFEQPEPIPPGKVIEYTIDLHTNDHCFLKGHQIMVQVQSTWFPVIDRNPQKFVPNIFKATAADFQKATQRIYFSKRYSSNVEIPVVEQ